MSSTATAAVQPDDGLTIPTPPPKLAALKAVVLALIDETGSMASIAAETVVGVNSFFGSLQSKLDPDEAYVGALLFDRYGTEPVTRTLFTSTNIGAWQPMTAEQYKPRGYTPLYDAIAVAIAQAEHMVNTCHRNDGEERRVILMIQTDGQENSSRETTRERIAASIAAKRAAGWEIIFLGADLPSTDSIGASIGTQSASTMDYDPRQSQNMFAATASNAADFVRGQRVNTSYSNEQRNQFGNKQK